VKAPVAKKIDAHFLDNPKSIACKRFSRLIWAWNG